MNGTITSPMYPAVYPKSTVCKYEFIGQNTEKIQVKSVNYVTQILIYSSFRSRS